MAVLTAQDAPVAGLDTVSWTPASASGDEAPTGTGMVLLVRNDDAAAHTLTLATPGTVRGIPVQDVDVTIPAGEVAVVPLSSVYRNPALRRAALSWDGVTSVDVAVVRLPR